LKFLGVPLDALRVLRGGNQKLETKDSKLETILRSFLYTSYISAFMTKPAVEKKTFDTTGHDVIEIVGAREHNLKNINVSFPRN